MSAPPTAGSAPFPLVVLMLLLLSVAIGNGYADESTTAYPVLSPTTTKDGLVDGFSVECNLQEMVVTVSTMVSFHGMVYPRGLTKQSPCMNEFDVPIGTDFVYKVPLRSCNTMNVDTDDGYVEYFNTIVIQPHKKLVTSQGRGYHVRCRYPVRETAIISGIDVSIASSDEGATAEALTTPLPETMMHIYAGDSADHIAAENMRIGDNLTLVVTLEEQPIFGMTVFDCIVRDGLGWSDQLLYNDQGCPVDSELMAPFVYNANKTQASVKFQAYKFPYTASIYYQCNIRLCLRDGACEEAPLCDEQGNNLRRRRRRSPEEPRAEYRIDDPIFAQNATIEVFGGFYVSDTTDDRDTRLFTGDPIEEAVDEDQLCISPRDFAIGIAVAGLILMIAVIAAILFLCARRRNRKRMTSTTGSSLYSSGPYTNTAYSHSS